MSAKRNKAQLSVDMCVQHRFYAILLSLGTIGNRLTASKCCGSWSRQVTAWMLDADELRALARTCEETAAKLDELDRSGQPPIDVRKIVGATD